MPSEQIENTRATNKVAAPTYSRRGRRSFTPKKGYCMKGSVRPCLPYQSQQQQDTGFSISQITAAALDSRLKNQRKGAPVQSRCKNISNEVKNSSVEEQFRRKTITTLCSRSPIKDARVQRTCKRNHYRGKIQALAPSWKEISTQLLAPSYFENPPPTFIVIDTNIFLSHSLEIFQHAKGIARKSKAAVTFIVPSVGKFRRTSLNT